MKKIIFLFMFLSSLVFGDKILSYTNKSFLEKKGYEVISYPEKSRYLVQNKSYIIDTNGAMGASLIGYKVITLALVENGLATASHTGLIGYTPTMENINLEKLKYPNTYTVLSNNIYKIEDFTNKILKKENKIENKKLKYAYIVTTPNGYITEYTRRKIFEITDKLKKEGHIVAEIKIPIKYSKILNDMSIKNPSSKEYDEFFKKVFEKYDVLITPTTIYTAKLKDDTSKKSLNDILDKTFFDKLIYFSGNPSISLPLGNIVEIPFGISFISKKGNDKLLFNISKKFLAR